MINFSGQYGEMPGSEKKSEQEHKQQNFFERKCYISSIKRVTTLEIVPRCSYATATAKKCTKKCATRAKLFLMLIKLFFGFLFVSFLMFSLPSR